MHVSYEKERTAKDESDLVEAIFDCELARKQAGGLHWAEVLNRFVELKLYKSPESARRRFQKLVADGWPRKQGEDPGPPPNERNAIDPLRYPRLSGGSNRPEQAETYQR